MSLRSSVFHRLLSELGQEHDAQVAELWAQLDEVPLDLDDHAMHILGVEALGLAGSELAQPGGPADTQVVSSMPSHVSSLQKNSTSTTIQNSGEEVLDSGRPGLLRGSELFSSSATRARFCLREEWHDSELKLCATDVVSKKRKAAFQAGRSNVVSAESLGPSRGMRLWDSFPFHPRSNIRSAWQLAGALFIGADIIWLPLQAFAVPQYAVMWIPPMVFWTFDLLSNFVTSFYGRDGYLERSFSKIAWEYMRTWFVPDLLLVCNDLAASVLIWLDKGDSSQYGGLARMGKFLKLARNLRSLRLLRIVRIRGFLLQCLQRISSESGGVLLEMIMSAFGMMILNHLVACLWFVVGSVEDASSWIEKEGVDSRSFTTKYFYSLHWSLAQFTPASMEVFPQNTAERVFSVIVIILAMFTFSSFVSTITSGMTQLRVLHAEKAKQDFILRRFLREKKISQDLAERITRHLAMAIRVGSKVTAMQDVRLLGSLPGSLLLALQEEMFSPWLRRHEFFAEYLTMEKDAVQELFNVALKQQTYAAQEVLFRPGRDASHMYFVIRGVLQYQLPRVSGVHHLLSLSVGEWLSEAALWMRWLHRGEATLLEDGEIALLCAKNFLQVTVKYPETLALAKYRASAFRERLLSLESIHDAPDLLHVVKKEISIVTQQTSSGISFVA